MFRLGLAGRGVVVCRRLRVLLASEVVAATPGGGGGCHWIRTSPVVDSIQVKMPSLSPTMTEGTIVQWTKKEGEDVSAGDVLCEIQTDKAVVALEADDDGKMAKIFKDQNSGNIQVGTLIAVMADSSEDWQVVAKSPVSSDTEETRGSSATESKEEGSSTASGGSTPGTEVKMPSLSPTMTEGTIVKWCKQEGEKISAGDVLVEIQTDKAVVSMEVDDDAILAKILFKEGEAGIQVGQLIALTVGPDEDWKDVSIPAAQKASQKAAVQDKASTKKDEKSATSKVVGEHHFEHVPNVGPATCLLMAQYGIKTSEIPSSGPKGVLKGDVLRYIKEKDLKPLKVEASDEMGKRETVQPPKKKVSQPTSGYTDHPLSSMRAVIAKRLSQSKQTSPHGHATAAADISAVLRLRKDFESHGTKVSVNDFVIKAVAGALQHVPEMNLNVNGEDFQIMPNIDISVAVATDKGLITPIVKDVARKSIPQIAADVKDLAKKAREGKLQLNEFQGGTFTISNLGMFGILEFTAIINPPQVAILAVGSGVPKIDPATGKVMTLMRSTLSFDRRFIDEALAADFMSTFQTILERPEFLNLGLEPIVRKNRVEMQVS